MKIQQNSPTIVFHKLFLFIFPECTSSKENWMCLNCGQVLCGRYENGHALHHSTENTQHYVCLNTLNCSVYCYKCDDFVINDTGKNLLDNLRQELKDDDSSSEASLFLDEPSSVKSSPLESTSTSSSDSGWFEEPMLAGPSTASVVRKLRPRKRTSSSDSNEAAKKKSLRKVVGLRNLGNTCFMNSVLQSLSNIQEFSCYFNSLPSLESKQQQQQQKRIYYSRSMKENGVSDANVAEELRKVLTKLNQGGDGTKAISPECLFLVIWKVVPQFRGHRQHDAHEFLRYMLDRLHMELQILGVSGEQMTNPKVTNKLSSVETSSSESNSINLKGKDSIVTDVFGGTLQSEVSILNNFIYNQH